MFVNSSPQTSRHTHTTYLLRNFAANFAGKISPAQIRQQINMLPLWALTQTSRRLVYRACVLAFSQESLWWPSCLSLGICRTFEAIIIMFGHKMWLIPLCFIFSSFFTCICTLLWTPGVERGCFRMPCFLMDLRFATGRQQKIRTFRFFSGAALSLHVRSKSLGVCKCKRRGR